MSTWNASTMKDEISRAAEHLLQGGIILYPTDTIWGIGCDATDPGAVERIYRIKERFDRKSMLVLMDSLSMVEDYVESIPSAAYEVMEIATRPTTIIYPAARNLAPNLVAGDGSIGIRIPDDPFCLGLIGTTGRPIVSTSANISGNPPPQLFGEIVPEIILAVDYAVDWRRKEGSPATPSTVIKIDGEGRTTVLRP